MGCRSDYQQDYPAEIEASKVLALLNELKTGKPVNASDYGKTTGKFHTWGKYDYKNLDVITEELCTKLQNIENVSVYSLEMQIWWRDHKEADKQRIKRELAEQKTVQEKQAAIAKLTDHERKLLGL